MTTSSIDDFDAMPEALARELLLRCCGSAAWVEAMMRKRPFGTEDSLFSAARAVWEGLGRKDWLEAFSHHPKIGDIASLRRKFASTADMASKEQAGVSGASEQVLSELATGNADYEKKFGYIFIVFASGKSAGEMNGLLRSRLGNPPEAEIRVAAGEQAKITENRLRNALADLAAGGQN